MAGDERGTDEGLVAARRMYDQQVAELESIDDKALRTLRTDVIILGFVAAALTAGSPSDLNSFHWLPVGIAISSAIALFASAFLCVGTYLITEIPLEVQSEDLRAAKYLSQEAWIEAAPPRLRAAISDIEREIARNGDLLGLAMSFLLSGAVGLAYATGLVVAARSYSISPVTASIIPFVVSILGAVFVMAKRYVSGWSIFD